MENFDARQFSNTEIAEGILNEKATIYQYVDKRFRKATVAYVLKNKGAVSDGHALYNEVLLIIYQNISTGKYDSTKGIFDAYYWRIAKWRWIDKLRKRSNEIPIANESFLDQTVQLEDFEVELTKLHKAEMLKHCIEQLNAASAEILQLYYFQNLNIAEVAAKVGKEIEAVKQSLHRSRSRLKQCLENKPDFVNIT